MNRRLVLPLALLLLPVAPRALGQDAPVEPPAAKAAETDEQVLERITGEMMKRVEELRGLKFKKDVKRVWKSRDEAKAEMLADIDRDTPPEKLAAQSREMAFFGFVPEGTDLKQVYASLISAGAGGYYKPDTKVFSLVRGFKEDASRPIVFHELIHALEDQYFDYQARMKRCEDTDMGDHAAAIQGIVEGSARVFEDRFVDSEEGLRMKYFRASLQGSAGSMGEVADLPPVILAQMQMYPYGNGSEFLKVVAPALEAKGAKDGIAAVYANPPSSTEQVLHPQKYLDSDLPRAVRLPDLLPVLGEGWTEIGQGEQGELTTGLAVNAVLVPYSMAAQTISLMKAPGGGKSSKEDQARFLMTPVLQFHRDAARAAEGWDGDRYALYGNGDRTAMLWVSVWDTPADAAEFAEIYGKVLSKKYGAVKEEEVEGKKPKKVLVPLASAEFDPGEWIGMRWAGTREGDSAILVKGDRVLVLERIPTEALAKAAAEAAKAEIVQDPRDTVPAREK